MTTKEEFIHLREENRVLREVLTQRDEQVKQMQEQITRLSEQVKSLQDRLAKDSHNSHLPPSSDRFVRPRDAQRDQAGREDNLPYGLRRGFALVNQERSGETHCTVKRPERVLRKVGR